jgi:hypothetical protein
MMQPKFQVAPLYFLAFQVEQVLQFCNQAYILHQEAYILHLDFKWNLCETNFGGGSCHLGRQGGRVSNNPFMQV